MYYKNKKGEISMVFKNSIDLYKKALNFNSQVEFNSPVRAF